MKNLLMLTALITTISVPLLSQATTPEEDKEIFQGYMMKRFPNVPKADFSNGVYAIDKDSRAQWEEIEEFAPYELAIAEGEELFGKPFKNGKTYGSCFPNNGIGVKQNYPYFDSKRGEVVTLELAINECRVNNGEKPLGYKKGKIASISAYMAYTSRGNIIDVKIPNELGARLAYEDGKQFYYTRRGQLNMSCAHCHVDNTGNRVRTEIISPPLGHSSHWPVYRAKWGAMGTLHRRFGGCNEQVRAKSFPAQSKEYRNLEYFLTYMSNGLPWNGPGVRK